MYTIYMNLLITPQLKYIYYLLLLSLLNIQKASYTVVGNLQKCTDDAKYIVSQQTDDFKSSPFLRSTLLSFLLVNRLFARSFSVVPLSTRTWR